MSLEREVDQMLDDMMRKEGWKRSYALSVLRSKFESEERYQEVAYVDNLIKNEGEDVEKEPKFEPTTKTTNTVAEQITETKELAGTIPSSVRTPSKATPQQELEETISSKSISKQLDKQTIQINKKIAQMLQPLQKHLKSVDKQSQLIRQLQSQLKQLQRQVSQIQKTIGMGKGKKKDSK
ncbi:MAG TPA: hypothetical protein VI278_14980 [Nitrososphaeraceae archaeon]